MRLARRVFITAQVIGTLLHVAVWVEQWEHRPAIWMLLALFVVVSIGNPMIAAIGGPRLGRARSEKLRNAFNVAVHVPIGAICGWSLASWLFIPFLVSLASVPPTSGRTSVKAFTMLAVIDGLALATGAHGPDILLFTAVSLAIHFLIDAYLVMANNLVREREAALAQLAATQKQLIANARLASLGQIAAGVAHEINNPMCFVTSNVEQLLEDIRSGEVQRHYEEYRDVILPETLDGIVRVNAIVDDLRRFARGEPEEHVELDLSNEVRIACRMAQMQAGPDRELHLHIPDGIHAVGMRRQLGQVVLNLVVNALQALEDRGHVYVELEAANDAITLVVRDDGVGMSEEIKQQVFDPFFTTKAESRGTGLGLSVVHGIVIAHGGTIAVESSPGNGTTFTVCLPAPVPATAAMAA